MVRYLAWGVCEGVSLRNHRRAIEASGDLQGFFRGSFIMLKLDGKKHMY